MLSESKAASDVVIEYLKDERGRLSMDKLEALLEAFDKERQKFPTKSNHHSAREAPFASAKVLAVLDEQ